MKQEQWRTISNHSRYKISNLGKVFDLKLDRELSLTMNGGFLCTNIIQDSGIRYLAKIHRIVATAFLPNPDNHYLAKHKDGDVLNNTVDNIYWHPKVIKELSPRKLKQIPFNGKSYSYKQFAELCGVSKDIIESRIDHGRWSPEECYRGRRDFKDSGYIHPCYSNASISLWFPYKYQLEEYQGKTFLYKQKQLRDEKALIKASKPFYKKYGVGVYENSPIAGIVGRKALRVYVVWHGLLARCYNTNHHSWKNYGGRGVYVCDEWLIFQNFAKWYNSQYKEQDWHLDKDILVKGNLVYSPSTCCFVPPKINCFFATIPSSAPVRKEGNRWSLNFSVLSDKIYQSSFDKSEMIELYCFIKEEICRSWAIEYNNRISHQVIDILSNFTLSYNL